MPPIAPGKRAGALFRAGLLFPLCFPGRPPGSGRSRKAAWNAHILGKQALTSDLRLVSLATDAGKRRRGQGFDLALLFEQCFVNHIARGGRKRHPNVSPVFPQTERRPMRLDNRTIAELALPLGKAEQIYWDDELRGFGLRLRLRGNRLHRTWIAQYRADGRQRRPTLGTLDMVRPAEARAAARKLLAKVALGSDPQGEKEAKQRAAARTFRAVVASYLEARARELRPSSYRVTKLYLTGPYFRPLHAFAISAITHADVAACIRAIENAHSTPTAGAARRAISTLFGWAIAEGLMPPPNPVIGTRRPTDPIPRDRVLSGSELAAIWNATSTDADYHRIVRLLILTGARAQEIGGMCWSELDLDVGTWSLPKARSKNGRAHEIVLPAAALAILRAIERQGSRDLLFGVRGDSGFTHWSDRKRDLDLQLAGKVRPWRLHDVRRSVATGMADIGIAPHIVEAVLNHYSGHRRGVGGIYNRSRYDREVTAALARWAAHLADLVEGRKSKVITLHS